ncbi:unnamed protein product [Anisakis simplex]|uniref:Uncharacterized protein n=1 Tax=Anisakis simplex TaxID=6269 RepID=A0A0M3JXV9_ANISI|nr:unnamed protein product [Anisakis simplex]
MEEGSSGARKVHPREKRDGSLDRNQDLPQSKMELEIREGIPWMKEKAWEMGSSWLGWAWMKCPPSS